MARRNTHQTDVRREVLQLTQSKVAPGQPITDHIWNMAYDLVWAKHALETIEFKAQLFTSNKPGIA